MATMGNDFTKSWENYYSDLNEPLTEMANLNMASLNKTLTRNSKFMNEFMKAKKLEDIISLQTQFLSEINAEAVDYFQRGNEALQKCCSHSQSHFNDLSETAFKAGMKASPIKPASGPKSHK